MGTKVKGDAIKESSIPFSALVNSLQEEINAKYGLNGYVGELSSSNTKIESPSSILYLYFNGEVYNNMIGSEIIIHNGPTVIFKFTSYGYKTTVEIKEGVDNIGYYGKGLVFTKYNSVPKEIPDWNAKENEDGHIKNKPFYDEYIEYTLVEKDGEYIYYLNMWSTDDEYYKNSVVEYYDPSNFGTFELSIGPLNTNSYFIDLGYQLIEFYSYFDEDEGCVCFRITYENGPIDERVLSSIKFKTVGSYLSSRYIPNTVLKTTPQTLSDNDKNQALANLGIDPVVCKYMCNPFVIPYAIPGGYELPSDLNRIIWNDSLDGPSARMYNLLYRKINNMVKPLSDWSIQYVIEGDTGNASLTFDIDGDYAFEIDVYGTVTEL